MTKLQRLASSFAVFTLLGVAGCSSSSGATTDAPEVNASSAKTIQASTDGSLDALAGVFGIRNVPNQDGVGIRLIETAGGDPALNGNRLYLAITGEHGEGGVFDLDMDVNTVVKAEGTTPGSIVISTTSDSIDENGNPTTHPLDVKVEYTVADGVPGASVITTWPADPQDERSAADAPEQQILSEFYQVTTAEHPEGVVARLYEQAGGDPAMNGDQLYLSLIVEHDLGRVFNLGLNVAGVTKIEAMPSAGDKLRFRIDGTEDTMDADGNIASKPFAYSLSFTVNADGVPSEALQLQKL